MSSTFSRVAPVRPATPYVGGKRSLARRLIDRIDAVDHQIYAEPFVGAGGVFLRRGRRPASELVNDFSGDVANFFRILQRHYPQFMDTLKYQVTSRREFERLAKTDPATLTDLERAGRFLYLQRLAFGGKVVGRNFGVDVARGARFDLVRLAPVLEDLHERLSGVVIENLDFEKFIRRYDRPGVLFFCDPPYWGTEGYYGAELFARADFERLAATLQQLQGRFILSLNDRPEVRALFSWASIEAVTLNYGVGGGMTPAAEVIISN